MQQKNSFFKAAMAAVLTLGAVGVSHAAYPAATALDGEYAFSAKVEYGDAATTLIKSVLQPEFKFNIQYKGTSIKWPTDNDFGNVGVTVINYDQDRGTITLGSNNLGSVGGFSGNSNDLGLTTLDGKWTGVGQCDVIWQVSESGNITVPDFAVVDYSDPKIPIVAKYTDVQVKSTSEPAAPKYPTIEEIVGYYHFTSSDFTLEDTGNQFLKGEFNFTINYEDEILTINHFLYNNFLIGTPANRAAYNEETGVLSFTGKSYYVYGHNYGIAPEGQWNGFSDVVYLTFQFQPDGTIVIPDFDIIKYSGATITEVLAVYKNNTAKKADPFGGDDDGPIVGDKSIEGIWTMTNWDIMGESATGDNGGVQTYEYHATLDGNIVYFEEQGSGDAAGRPGTYHMIGKFTSPTTILMQRAMIGDETTANPLYQVAFTNGKEEYNEDPTYLNDESWTLTYDPEMGTLTPPTGNKYGLYYAYFEWETTDRTEGVGIQGAFIFVSGQKDGDFTPGIEISGLKPVVSGDQVTVTFDVALERFGDITPAKWEAVVTQFFSDTEEEKDWTETTTVPCTVQDGKGSFTVSGLQGGRNDFQVYIVAYDQADNQIAASNGKSFTAETGGFFDISNVSTALSLNTLTITCTLRPVGLDTSKIDYYEATLTDSDTGDIFKSTEVDGPLALLQSTFVIPKAGFYNFKFEVSGFNKDGEKIAFTNMPVILDQIWIVNDLEDDGVEAIDAEQNKVTYFNLQGLEVKQPARGAVVIKISGSKAEKIIF